MGDNAQEIEQEKLERKRLRNRERQRRWRANNKEHLSQYRREYAKKNQEKIREMNHAQYLKRVESGAEKIRKEKERNRAQKKTSQMLTSKGSDSE